jgi:hypothetical protein
MTLDSLLTWLRVSIVNPFIYLMLGVSALYFVWGVFVFVRDSENETARSTGKRHMIYGVIGLAIMLGVKELIAVITKTVT